LIIIRVIILVFLCIYIPLETIFSSKFDEFEQELVFPFLDESMSKISTNPTFIYITDWLFFLVTDRDYIMIYMGIIYIVYHPFIAVKISFVTHFVQYFIILLRCMLQSYRPIWKKEKILTTNFCFTTFANPSEHFFYISFFYAYMLISIHYHLVNKKKTVSLPKKLLFFAGYLIFVFFFGIIFVIKKSNYIYQLNFAFTIGIITLCAVIDLENYIHNFILNCLKNVLKIRTYKIKLFLLILGMNIFSVICYNFLPDEEIEGLQENLMLKKNCSPSEVAHAGLKSTFDDISYLFGVMGAYWGTSLTVEKNCGQWWGMGWKNLLLKISCLIVIGWGYIILFSNIFNLI
jgi:hypothetical protein